VSSGQVDAMLKYLAHMVSVKFSQINVSFGTNNYGDTRCYLTINHFDGAVIQWFKDRSPSQVAEFAESFLLGHK
jgi:hypothetical protein